MAEFPKIIPGNYRGLSGQLVVDKVDGGLSATFYEPTIEKPDAVIPLVTTEDELQTVDAVIGSLIKAGFVSNSVE